MQPIEAPGIVSPYASRSKPAAFLISGRASAYPLLFIEGACLTLQLGRFFGAAERPAELRPRRQGYTNKGKNKDGA
jgi:hypothetical protein